MHWEVPSTGTRKEKQQPTALALLSPLTKRKYLRNQWVCLGSLAGCSLPRWFRAGAVRKAKEAGPEDLWGSLPTQIISGPETVTFNPCLLIYLSST